jgi:hypothetical protein
MPIVLWFKMIHQGSSAGHRDNLTHVLPIRTGGVEVPAHGFAGRLKGLLNGLRAFSTVGFATLPVSTVYPSKAKGGAEIKKTVHTMYMLKRQY